MSGDRIAVTKSGRHVTSVRRDTIRSVRVVRESASEQPVREMFWGGVLALIGAVTLAQGLRGDEGIDSGRTIAGLILIAIAGWMGVHLLRRVPQLRLQGPAGIARIVLSAGVTQPEMVALEQRLRELGYPVQ